MASENDSHDGNECDTVPEFRERPQKPLLTPIQIQEDTISIDDDDDDSWLDEYEEDDDNISLTEVWEQMRQKAANAYSLQLAELQKIASNSGDETSQRELRIALSLAGEYKIQTSEYKTLKRQTALFEYFPNVVLSSVWIQ